ncbi:hypothetical protein EVAR_52845_1 [Eumeta japonica]|uniref:Uncharacterized protein n=1 Tax=Eumeta variegata TaxID=151549 RepID=A0A4C1YF77_EUMVA|nr:hypothetical protein EVAR_52845_1 [Eumeta japonica]
MASSRPRKATPISESSTPTRARRAGYEEHETTLLVQRGFRRMLTVDEESCARFFCGAAEYQLLYTISLTILILAPLSILLSVSFSILILPHITHFDFKEARGTDDAMSFTTPAPFLVLDFVSI